MSTTCALDHPYLRSQLIAYIGNKRSLLPFLHRVFSRLHEQRPVSTFLDPFAGSGSVARLARWMGFVVHANDWEDYAYLLNLAYLVSDDRQADLLFEAHGGIDAVIGELNSLSGEPEHRYISRHYAPHSTAEPDYRRERLFYTRENASFLDRVREEIERRFPPDKDNPHREHQRALLLAPLLYEAATHANTSGVFKACHKGFGGHSGDALGRIMAPMRLERPALLSGPLPDASTMGERPSGNGSDRGCPNRLDRGSPPGSATMQDAALCCRSRSADLVYLDPPYNQHQYGSNYFMLNTIARWDRPEVSDDRHPDGTLRQKAGIRADWKKTRSDFCSRRTATAAFQTLLYSIDSGRIVLSYNDRGTIPMEELLEICAGHGRVTIDGTDHVAYRGGRQSPTRSVAAQEFVVIIDRGGSRGDPGGRKLSAGNADVPITSDVTDDPSRFLRLGALLSLVGKVFSPKALQRLGCVSDTDSDGLILVAPQGIYIEFRFDPICRLRPVDPARMAELSSDELSGLYNLLKTAACGDYYQEADVLLHLIGNGSLGKREGRVARQRFLLCLRKLAHRKHRVLFEELRDRVLAGDPPALHNLSDAVIQLNELAAKRSAG